jgi:Zn-dependent oligopeptidase
LDELSDILCHATDAAAFCAAAHADPVWRQAAQQSHQHLQGYLAQLNTSSVLWTSLRRSMELAHQPSVVQGEGWTPEEIKVGDSLMHEFEQAGMALDEDAQAQYRLLSMQQQRLCARLVEFEVCTCCTCRGCVAMLFSVL